MSSIISTTTELSGEFNDALFDKSELSHGSITGVFNNCSFTRADLRHANIIDAVFTNCDFSITDSCYSAWTRCKFVNCNVSGADFSRAEFAECIFDNTCILAATILDKYTDIYDCTLATSDLLLYSTQDMTDNLSYSVSCSIQESINNIFKSIVDRTKQELESDRVYIFMVHLFKNIRCGHKSQSLDDENLVKIAKNDPTRLSFTPINELKSAYLRMYKLAGALDHILEYLFTDMNESAAYEQLITNNINTPVIDKSLKDLFN